MSWLQRDMFPSPTLVLIEEGLHSAISGRSHGAKTAGAAGCGAGAKGRACGIVSSQVMCSVQGGPSDSHLFIRRKMPSAANGTDLSWEETRCGVTPHLYSCHFPKPLFLHV